MTPKTPHISINSTYNQENKNLLERINQDLESNLSSESSMRKRSLRMENLNPLQEIRDINTGQTGSLLIKWSNAGSGLNRSKVIEKDIRIIGTDGIISI